MGVPKLFKIILDKFPASHAKVNNQPIDYLFIDFNSVIYESYEKVKIDAELSGKNLEKSSRPNIENLIIKKMIQITTEMIKDYVKPIKMVYLALDGPPPRGKMTQQRDRRYKRLYENFMQQKIQEKYGITDPVKEPWSTAWITPGTEFMRKVSLSLHNAILHGTFPKNIEYVLSDTSVPGEGEHKFLKFLDQLPTSNICIYSNDGDVIMLVNRFPQHTAYILTKPKDTSRVVQKYYSEDKYMYLVVKGLHQGFKKQFNRLDFENINLNDLTRDYIFFSMLGGNDFVQHIYFLRMKDEHTFKVLKGVYQVLQPEHGNLVDEDLKINQKFLTAYLIKLAQQEKRWLREKQKQFLDSKPKLSSTEKKKQAKMSEWEKEWEAFQHTYYYKRNHPLYDKYKDEFKKIDYELEPNSKWKTQYYKEFFNVDYSNKKDINRICYQYLKSWYFCLHYYLDELPSWRWYYPYHAAPLPSDMIRTLQKIKDINNTFKFEKGRSFKPLEQLMLVLPHKNVMMSDKFKKIMKEHPEFYPEKFKLNVLWGQKYIYSEPELPNINAKVMLKEFNKVQLNVKEKELNKLYEQPLYYPIKE